MPTALQLRRGSTSQNNSFTGAVGEVSVDTDKDTLRVHDGSTAGGFEVVTATATQTLTNKTLTSPNISGAAFTGASFTFEGSTSDSFETTLTVVDPTADRTVTIPNATTTLVGTDVSQTLTNKTLTTPIINEIDGSTITLDASADIVLDADGANITMKDGGTTVLDFVLNGSTDVTLDAPGDIKLDADGADVLLLDGGSQYGALTNNSSNLIIKSGTTTAATFSGANVTLAGTVGSGAITSTGTVTGTALTLTSGGITFEGATDNSFETTFAITDPTADRTITFQDATTTVVGRDTTDTLTNKTLTTPVIAEIDSTGSITLDAAADIVLDAGGADVTLKDDGTTFGALNNNGGELRIQSGSTPTTAITMSGANVTIAGNLTVSGSTTTVDSSTISVTNSFTFEGSTADSFETTLTVEDPTADRTVTIPNATTQLVGRDTTDTLTNKTLTTPVITEIDSGSTITLDAATDIILDADGANITFKDGGTTVLDFVLDGTTSVTLDAGGDISLDADGGDIFFKDAGTTFGSATNNSGNLIIKSGTTTAATFTGANVTFAGTVDSGAITSTGSVTGTGFVTTGSVQFEGSTADSFETTLGVIDPTADRSVNIANAAGTLQPFAAASTTQITATPDEVNIMDGGTTVGTTAVADDDGIVTNDGGTMKQTKVQTFATYFASEITNMGNLVETGTLNAGAISSGFGNIDNGSSTLSTGAITTTGITNTGTVVFEGATADSFETTLTVVDPTGDRTVQLPNASTILVGKDTTDTLTNKTLTTPTIAQINATDFLVDASGDITLDADGDNITLKAGGTTALDFVLNGATDVTLDAPGDIHLDADGGDIRLYDGGTGFAAFTNNSTDFDISVTTQDKDINFKGDDGGSGITALTLDMSDAGAATFNAGITATTGTFTAGASVKNGATGAGFIEFFEDSDNGTNKITVAAPASCSDRSVTFPDQAGTIVLSNDTAGNDVRLDSLGVATDASGTSGEIRATNDITAFHSSDVALKENIVNIPSPLEMIKKINGVFFDWKDSFIKAKGGEDGYFVRKHDVGVIAQDVEKVMPEVVGTRPDGIKAVKYDRLVTVLIEAVKELTEEVNNLKKNK